MPEAYLSSNIGNTTIGIDTSQIYGSNGYFSSTLNIPVSLNFEAKDPAMSNERFGQLVGVEAKLIFRNWNLSQLSFLPNKGFTSNHNNAITLSFSVHHWNLQKLEAVREKDVDFKIEISLVIAKYDQVVSTENKVITVCSKFEFAEGSINFTISQSDWLKLLSSVGYKAFEMIEIPSISDMIGEEYQLSLNELKEANKYLLRGDFDKVVSHCRSALEPIKRRFPGLKDRIKKGLSSEWIDIPSSATLEWLDKLFKFQADITNKTHHVPSIGHYSKHEAEAIYMLTVATISMAGQIAPIDGG